MTNSATARAALMLALAMLPFACQAIAQSSAPEALARFPIAHQHSGGWCLGYLYIYPDSIAYDVTWPASDRRHSFTLQRSELKQVGRWSRAGQPLKAVELKSAKTTYHLWWLANEQDVVSGRAYQSDPADAGDPDLLIAAIRDPATLANGASTTQQGSGNPASTSPSELQQVPDSPMTSVLASSSPQAATSLTSSAEMRFAVAHAHVLAFCVGYLYVAPDHIRYEVVQPAGDKKHSMNWLRSEITAVQQWIAAGTRLNAAEIRTAHGNYHFWLLPEGSDVVNTPYRQWNINNMVAVQPLITALQAQR